MLERAQVRRRGRGAGLAGVLVEREPELAGIEHRLRETREGAGGVVVVEAPAGNGKSRLLTVAGDLAREAGMRVVGAYASELEREFPFGIAVQLFEPPWMAAEANERARLAAGPARQAGELLAGTMPDVAPFPGDRGYATIHSLFWLAVNLLSLPDRVEEGSLVMLVDDLQWVDRPSLRFLAYLAQRVAELPILLVASTREGEASPDPQALAALRTSAYGTILSPRSLTEGGVAAVVRTRFVEAEPEFCRACARVTGGNPFLLIELLDELRADGVAPTAQTAGRLSELAPEAVLAAVVARLGAMPDATRRVASAVAVLGDGAPVPRVAALAGLEPSEVSGGADILSAVHLFYPGAPLSFVHPLIAAAVRSSISPLEHDKAHRRAAGILAGEGAPEEQIAAHLLVAAPTADPHALSVLRSAARKAMASGDVETAVRMLERALAESPPADLQPEILAELGEAELSAGLPNAPDRLREAIALTSDPARQAPLVLAQAQALSAQARHREAAESLARALDELSEDQPAAAAALEVAYIKTASLLPDRFPEAWTRGARMVARLEGPPTTEQREAIAHLAGQRSVHGGERAEIVELAELTWGDGALLEARAATSRMAWPLLTGALLIVDELERALEMCDAALAAGRRAEAGGGYPAACHCRTWPEYESGRIADALADAQLALDASPEPLRGFVHTAYGAVALSQIERGELEEAQRALSTIEQPEIQDTLHLPFLLDVRAQLRLAQHRPADALEDALTAGRILEADFGGISPGAVSWRSTAALAHLALGEPDRARELAWEELALARRLGITRVVIRALRVLGLSERGDQGIELLSEAVETGEGYPTRLEHIRALIDLGAALRRANRRAAAREPLRRALERSHAGGASALEERTRRELVATGARPRRAALSGLESLTPSELRVGELAGRSMTTRQIGDALFVTPKTVEYHLRHIYQKLDINSREELAAAMRRAQSGSS